MVDGSVTSQSPSVYGHGPVGVPSAVSDFLPSGVPSYKCGHSAAFLVSMIVVALSLTSAAAAGVDLSSLGV